MIALARPLIASSILLASATALRAQTDSCGPDMRALFDFRAGDIFQYNQITSLFEDGNSVGIRAIRKVHILRRLESADSLSFESEVRERELTETGGVPDVETRYDMVREILTYRDGPENPFDACLGDTVTMPIGPETSDSFRTLVDLYKGHIGIFPLAKPGQRMKTFGYPLWTSAGLPAEDRYFFKSYAEGLGLVKMMQIGRGTNNRFDSLTLIGYVRGGDTVGVIHPDSDYEPVTALRRGISLQAEPSSVGRIRLDLLGRRHPVPGATDSRFGSAK